MEFSAALLSHDSEVPLYRQVSELIATQIRSGAIPKGSRLPATRELAGLLGLNRTTVSAAYEILEADGLIAGQVGRGSFVTGGATAPAAIDWSSLLERGEDTARPPRTVASEVISFAMSRPSRDLFPLDDF